MDKNRSESQRSPEAKPRKIVSRPEIGQRLRKIVDELGGAAFVSREFDIPRRTLNNYLTGRSDPPIELLNRFIERGFNIEWVLRGTMPAKRLDAGLGLAPAPEGIVHVPFYESPRASMGAGAVIEAESSRPVAFDEVMLRREIATPARHLGIMAADGKSMEPTIRSGELVLFDTSEEAKRPTDGIFVIRLESTLMIKRLQRLPGHEVKVISDNTAFASYTVKLDDGTDFAILARVAVVFRKL